MTLQSPYKNVRRFTKTANGINEYVNQHHDSTCTIVVLARAVVLNTARYHKVPQGRTPCGT